jgi:hypothetical protein
MKTYLHLRAPKWLGGESPGCLGYMVTIATFVKGQTSHFRERARIVTLFIRSLTYLYWYLATFDESDNGLCQMWNSFLVLIAYANH